MTPDELYFFVRLSQTLELESKLSARRLKYHLKFMALGLTGVTEDGFVKLTERGKLKLGLLVDKFTEITE